jgi:hypothetical protein
MKGLNLNMKSITTYKPVFHTLLQKDMPNLLELWK